MFALRKLAHACLIALSASSGLAISFTGLKSIGRVAQVTKTDSGIDLLCDDKSQVRIAVLAPDLIRVRVGFGAACPERDHSWAIAKTSWAPSRWEMKEDQREIRIETDELKVVIRRAPLLIEFRDAKTHEVINSDQQPMAFDAQSGTVAAAKKLGLDEHFYGLGEKAARLDKRRGEFSMWTSDTPGYHEGTDPIYQSIPFYLGWQRGTVYGIFFDNSYRTHFDLGNSTQDYAAFSAEGGEMNYYFFWGPSMKKVVGRYTELTGRMPLPPKWALGNQQSRYSYYPDTMAEEIVRRYRAEDLPLDVLHLDIHYMNEYRDFTWHPERFPQPKALTDMLGRLGVKVVTIVDPGVKYQPPKPGAKDPLEHPELAAQDDSYYVYNQGVAQNFFLKRKSGGLYIGRVWPGDAVFVDYTIDAAAEWWGKLHRAYTDNGVAGIWDDMNEPSDFVDKSGKTQADVISYDGGTNSPYAKNRNVFALGMARATYEGLQQLRPNQRPFVITRAGYAGIQRYSTMWTGDCNSTWDALALSLPMFATLGLSGEAFVGGDIPGFMGRADGELLARWYEVGFLVPFCRNHCDNHGFDHEPWRFGQYYEDIVRKYLKLRYRLMPFLYTTMEEARRTGVAPFRPLLLNYQDDPNTLTIDDEFMIGDDLLCAPVLNPGVTSRLVYLPKGRWFDFWTGAEFTGGTMVKADAPLETVPLFIRGGSIIPMGPAMNFIGEKPVDRLDFSIHPDESGKAGTAIYEDDGESLDYQKGSFSRTEVTCAQESQTLWIVVHRPTGEFRATPRTLAFTVPAKSAPTEVLVDRRALGAIVGENAAEGWTLEDGRLVIRIRDDGAGHEIRVR